MEIRKVLNGQYEFVNSSRGNRSGFVHETTLFRDNREVGKHKCQYYNRTWECYTYQSVMRNCICDIIEDRQKEFINKCKQAKNIKRLVKAEKEKILEHFEQLVEIKELRAIYKELENRA